MAPDEYFYMPFFKHLSKSLFDVQIRDFKNAIFDRYPAIFTIFQDFQLIPAKVNFGCNSNHPS
jgi:hypothetical protein